jgi:hypothetical protein
LLSKDPTYTKLTDRGISFGVLRTNPKLTSNIKLTVDSIGSLWFNSIDATSELAQNKYKNFPISETSNHEVNIFKFYDSGKTPSTITFAVGSTVTIDTIAKDLKDQFDFDLYSSGAKYLSSKNYSEKFSYFAPLYLDSVIPECFVIFKMSGASNYSVGEWQTKLADPNFSRTDFALDLFKNANIVKTIDLTETSKVGTYIRNIQKNPMYSKNPLYVNFKEDRFSVYRGASIARGTYVEMPELINSTLRRSIPQLKLEEYITGGFERNNIIYPRILNLEFLFNDDTSDLYTFNRYFGFYCNQIDLIDFDIDLAAMYSNKTDNSNSLQFLFRKEDDVVVSVSNTNGIKLRGIGISSDLTDLANAMTDSESIFFPYVKDKANNISIIDGSTFNQAGSRIDFSIKDNKIDLGMMFGPGELLSQETASSSKTNTRSTIAMTITTKPNHLDTIRVYHQNGSTFNNEDTHGRYDDIVFVVDDAVLLTDRVFQNNEQYVIGYPAVTEIIFDTEDPNLISTVFVPNMEQTMGIQYISSSTGTHWIWNGSLYEHGQVGARIYVNTNNATINENNLVADLTKLTETVISIIQSLKYSFLTGKSFKNTAFIQVIPTGNKYGQLALRILGPASSTFLLNGVETTETVYADGGFAETQQAIFPIGNIKKYESMLDDIIVKTEKDWSKVLRICNSVVSIDETVVLTEESVASYFKNATFMLKDDEPTAIIYNVLEIRSIYKPILGVLSMFEVKDIDFYTYSTQYAKIPEIDLYQYYYIPKNTKLLDFSKYVYQMIGSGQISINTRTYSTTNSTTTVWQNASGLHEYSVLNGDVILVQSNVFPANQLITRYDIPYLDEDLNLQNFTGFFSFGADHSTPNTSLPTYAYREKFKTNNLLSEYHVYLENFSKDYASACRVIPYISKWGILDSTDARGNPYRLNSDIMFGKDNFGPSHRETAPTSEKLTHEWFYIESDFNYSKVSELLKHNYYYFTEPLDVSKLILDKSYFERYFTYIPILDKTELDRPQFRYSKLLKDEFTSQYSTIFNGAKFIFSELGDDGNILANTDRFTDYNFSILLKPIKENLAAPQLPIQYRVIENVDAKSILILIEIAISDISAINTTLLRDNNKLPDNRLDQATVLLDECLLIDPVPSTFTINYVYTSENSVAGDSVFNTILTSNYPSFSSTNYRSGETFDTTLNLMVDRIPMAGDTMVIRKGSNLSEQFIVAFADSAMFIQAGEGQLQSGSTNVLSATYGTQYISVGVPKLGYLGTSSSQFRIVMDIRHDLTPVQLSPTYQLSVIKSVPGFLSIFGDYRLEFNENGVSNLTYNFLYSAKDKKYNSNKAAYSTIKLAIGVDISPIGVTNTTIHYYLTGKPIDGLNTADFKLEDFVNPISGSHDTLTVTSGLATATPPVTAPLPAFAPLMFINKNGQVSLLINTNANFAGDRYDLQYELSNPAKTTQSVIRIDDNLLTLDKNLGLSTVILNANLDSAYIYGPSLKLTAQPFPSGSSALWLVSNQQFQLFGGKDYFANLFEYLSFAGFTSLLEKNSVLISWESYENGLAIDSKKITIQVESADLISKTTIVSAIPEIVNTASKTQVGGFTHTEDFSTGYEISRYSGEYEVLYRPISGFKQDSSINEFSLIGANVFLNPKITDFFVIPEFFFVKYSDFNILDFENSQKFEPVYPMIFESPIDHDSYPVLASSWDFNYHYDYSNKSDKITIPGSRRLTEDYSFVSKLLNVPLSIVAESFTSIKLSNRGFELVGRSAPLSINGTVYDIAYSAYPTEVKFTINFAQVVAKALSETINGEDRLRVEFQKFFTDSNSQPIVKDPLTLGPLTFDQYLYQYCTTNLLKLYALDVIDFYERPDHTIPDNSISIANVPYDQLDNAGYTVVKSVKINKTNNNLIFGSILKKSSSGISLVPKLKIKYI